MRWCFVPGRWRRHAVVVTLIALIVGPIAACQPPAEPPPARAPAPRLLAASVVETETGPAQFHQGEATVAGAALSLSQPTGSEHGWDVTGDGQLEAFAVLSFNCTDLNRCGNGWGAWLGVWSWRGDRYRLVRRYDHVKDIVSFNANTGAMQVLQQTGPGRQDVQQTAFSWADPSDMP